MAKAPAVFFRIMRTQPRAYSFGTFVDLEVDAWTAPSYSDPLYRVPDGAVHLTWMGTIESEQYPIGIGEWSGLHIKTDASYEEDIDHAYRLTKRILRRADGYKDVDHILAALLEMGTLVRWLPDHERTAPEWNSYAPVPEDQLDAYIREVITIPEK